MAMTRGESRQLQMVCTETGYAIIDEFAQVLLELSIAAGQPILHHAYQNGVNSPMPEVASIFLRGVLAGHHAADVVTPPIKG